MTESCATFWSTNAAHATVSDQIVNLASCEECRLTWRSRQLVNVDYCSIIRSCWFQTLTSGCTTETLTIIDVLFSKSSITILPEVHEIFCQHTDLWICVFKIIIFFFYPRSTGIRSLWRFLRSGRRKERSCGESLHSVLTPPCEPSELPDTFLFSHSAAAVCFVCLRSSGLFFFKHQLCRL